MAASSQQQQVRVLVTAWRHLKCATCSFCTWSREAADTRTSDGALLQPATGWTLWVKNAAVRGARYDFIKHVDSQLLVAEFILRWVAELKLDCHPSLVDLRLVPCTGEEEPAPEQEAEATVLPPRKTLAQAGVVDGSWLVAVFVGQGHGSGVLPTLARARVIRLLCRRLSAGDTFIVAAPAQTRRQAALRS